MFSEGDENERKDFDFLMREIVCEKFLSITVELECDVVEARSDSSDVEHLIGSLPSGPRKFSRLEDDI